MAGNIFMEGFDLYNANLTETGLQAVLTEGYTPQVLIAAGRFGGQCLRVAGSGGTETQYQSLGFAATGQFTMGLAYKKGFAAAGHIIQTWVGTTDQVTLGYLADGTVIVRRGGPGGVQVAASAVGALPVSTWAYVEWQVLPHASAGTVKVWVDNNLVIDASALNTLNTAGSITNINYCEVTAQGDVFFDDVYFCDDATRYGPSRIDSLAPTTDIAGGNGVASVGTCASCVDESPSNGDTDYFSLTNVAEKQLMDVADLATTPTSVFAVQVLSNVKRTDAVATRAIRHIISDGTTEVASAVDKVLLTTYAFQNTIFALAPDGGAWSVAKVNALRVGVKVAA